MWVTIKINGTVSDFIRVMSCIKCYLAIFGYSVAKKGFDTMWSSTIVPTPFLTTLRFEAVQIHRQKKPQAICGTEGGLNCPLIAQKGKNCLKNNVMKDRLKSHVMRNA